MERYFDAKEFDRCRHFKRRFLGCEHLTLTGATVECKDGVVTVVDAGGNRGSFAYDSERRRAAFLAEIERGRKAEAEEKEWLAYKESLQRATP